MRDLAGLVARRIDQALTRYRPLRRGVVTAVPEAGKVRVDGRLMRHTDSIVGPAIGDQVIYCAGPNPVVIGRL